MSNLGSSRDAAQAATRTLSIPVSGREHIALTTGQSLELAFNPADVVFSRDGNHLVISGNNIDTGLTVDNFFAVEKAEALPQFVLPGGNIVAGADYLKGFGVDISTAAGPQPGASDSGGAGEYSSDAGSLLDGVERLGSLGTEHWGRSAETVETATGSVLGLAEAGTNADIDDSGYIARGVMYTHNAGTLPELQVDVLSVSGRTAGKYALGSAPASVNLAFLDADGEPVSDPVGYTYDQTTGKITFDNPPAGGGIFYVVITDGNGGSYTMQLVITSDKNFDSAAQDAATPPKGGSAAYGEWHSGRDTDADTDYTVTGGNLSDEMTFTGNITGGTVTTGHASGGAWGDDSVTVHGAVDKTDMDFGTGRGVLDIKNGLFAHAGDTTVTMAHGTIDINADKQGGGYGIHAADAGNAVAVTINAGDAAVRVGAGAQNGTAQAVAADKGDTVSITAGDVLVGAEGKYVEGIHAYDGSKVEISAKDVTVSVTGVTTAQGMHAQNDGENSITAGGHVGISTVAVAGVASGWGMSADYDGKNTVSADSVTIKASGESGLNYGLDAVFGGTNTISGVAGDVTIQAVDGARAHGVRAYGGGANTIESVSGAITIEARSTTNDAFGMLSQKGSNTITGGDNARLDVSAVSENGRATAVTSSNGYNGDNSGTFTAITLGDNAEVNFSAATGTGNAYALRGEMAGLDLTLGDNSRLSLSAESSGATVIAFDTHGPNTAAHSVVTLGDNSVFEVSGKADNSAGGIIASANGRNDITLGENGSLLIDIEARGGSSKGMGALAGSSTYAAANVVQLQGGTVDIRTIVSGNSATCMYIDYGLNRIESIGDNALRVNFEARGSHAYNAYAMYGSGGRNEIVSGGGDDVVVMAGNMHAAYADGLNLIDTGAGNDSIAITGNFNTNHSGQNLIDAGAGADTVSLTGNFTMDNAGKNTIRSGSGNDLVSITGNFDARANGENSIDTGNGNDLVFFKGDFTSAAGGRNIINTGTGDDHIVFDGKVQSLELNGGDGYDTLVLRAATWSEFTTRYQSLLTGAGFAAMSIESIRYDVAGGTMPAWFQTFVNNHGEVDFGKASFTTLDGVATSADSQYVFHEGNATENVFFGSGDDYVRIDGNMTGADGGGPLRFDLGEGRNSLTVDGSALRVDISGGDHGNSIDIHGSFDGHIGLGGGADQVDLGVLRGGAVDLGAGNDHLVLHGFTGGNLDGGTGHDILDLKMDGLGAEVFGQSAFSGLTTSGAVRGFEELLFDLAGGHNDTLALDDLLASLHDAAGNAGLTVRITGDSGLDHVDASALTAENGWTSGSDGVSTTWTHEDNHLTIMIESGLL